jgi:hypothetical protein
VLDFLKYVCHDHSNVKMMWHSLENEMSAEVVTKCNHLQFKGLGQRNTPCMTILQRAGAMRPARGRARSGVVDNVSIQGASADAKNATGRSVPVYFAWI